MTQLQALLLAVAFVFAVVVVLSVCVFVTAMVYEYRAWRHRRARGGMVTIRDRMVA